MKEIIKRFVVRSSAAGKAGAFYFKLALLAAGMLLTQIAGAQTNFASALVIDGDSGSVVVTNAGIIPESGTPTIAGWAPYRTVWFQWSTTNSGEVMFDTVGSSITNVQLDTVMGVYSGSSLDGLALIAANDNLNGSSQYNTSYQNYYPFADADFYGSTNMPNRGPQRTSVFSSVSGTASRLRFNAVAFTTYYIAVDTRGREGEIALNWALHPSGVFRFASETVDGMGSLYADGLTPMLMYQCAATESYTLSTRNDEPIRFSYLNSGTYGGGVLVTVTRVGGSYGRVTVNYTTADIDTNSDPSGLLLRTNGFLVNGDMPAVSGQDYAPVSGTLTFDNYEMSKTIQVPIYDFTSSAGQPLLNRDFLVLLTNVQVDVSESSAISQPRLDPIYNKSLVRILDVNLDPKYYSVGSVTNPVTTNVDTVYSLTATNSVFNFERAHYKVYRAGGNEKFTIYVQRNGTNSASASVHYRVNSLYPYVRNSGANTHNTFPLQPGSDYATPDPVNSTVIKDKIPDFIFPGGYDGTLSWGADDHDSKPIEFTVYDNGLQQFNEDFKISLYDLDKNGNPFPVGMVSDCSVTILNARDLVAGNSVTNQLFPPAGSVDELYNPDFANQYWLSVEPLVHPGTDGLVYGLAQQADGKTLLVGDFFTYNGYQSINIARVTAEGYFDPSFATGWGADNYIHCVGLTANNMVLIGGNFTSFNGDLASRIALLDTTGQVDQAFKQNVGEGFDGPVQCMVVQPDGKILVGGNFNTFNGTTRNYLARLNANGTLDDSFNAGTNITGTVSALALQANGQVIIGGSFVNLAGVAGQSHVGRVNANGTLDTTFNPGAGANGEVNAIVIQPDGKIVIGGTFSAVNGKTWPNLARLTAAGVPDATFNCQFGTDGSVYSLYLATNAIVSTTNYSTVVQTNFTIYVGGLFEKLNGTHRLGFGRLNANGSVDTSFMDTAYNQMAGLTRSYYGSPMGAVMATAMQADGKVLIGGSFQQLGGGEFNLEVRPDSFTDAYTNNPFSRAAVRNRSNFARLIGGATPGPGNIGLSQTEYSAGKKSASKFISLIRTNGFLGSASANFSIISGLAQNGVDYIYDGDYNGTAPLYLSDWNDSRMHSDGLYAGNSVPINDWGNAINSSSAHVNVVITGNTNNASSLNCQLQLSNPLNEDQFFLGGENIPLGVALGGVATTAPFTIIEDRKNSGTFGFASSTYSGSGPNVSIGLVRTNGTSGLVTVGWTTTTSGSTAVAGVDYQPAASTSPSKSPVSFQDSVMNGSFGVTILSSNYSSSIEKTVNLILTGVNPPVDGVASLGSTNAVLRIINPNFQGFLTLGTNAYGANLTAGSVTFTVMRTVGSKGTVTNQYCTINGSAVSGVDFVGVTNSLTWNNGDTSPRTITVQLLNNKQVGADKQFAIQIYNPGVNGTYAPDLFGANSITNALVTITNDNSYGTFQFSSARQAVNESGGYTTLTVVRTGSTNGTATVQYSTADSSAVFNENYLPTNGTLTFVPGQIAASFNVFVKSDGKTNLAPDAFYFTASLSNPSVGASLGTPSTTEIHINDDSLNRPPGDSDTVFNLGSGMNGDVLALALQSSGKIIAGGSFTVVNGTTENYLARLNGDFSLDYSGFLNGLPGFNNPVYALEVQSDDKILVGGAYTTVNGLVRNRITRLLTDGTQDSSFNPGAGANNAVYSLAQTYIAGQRSIYVGGAFTSMNGVSRPRLVRLTDAGTVDTAFNVGTGPNAAVYAIAVYPTNSVFAGQLLIGGAFTNINGLAASRIARLNANGTVDTNFSLQVNVPDTVRTIAIQNDGRILLGGDFTDLNGATASHVARLNSDGSRDTTFVGTVNGSVNAIAVQSDNRIVVGGQFSQANGMTRNNITRLLADGSADLSINFGAGANGSVSAITVQPGDQMLVIGGGFTTYNEVSAPHLVRIYGGSVTGSGAFKFTSPYYEVNENGAQALIEVRRTGGTSGPNLDGSGNVTVNFATSAGDTNPAVPGINYIATNLTLTFAPGETLKQVPVTVLVDSNMTADLMVKLTLTSPSAPSVLGDQNVADLKIINVDSMVMFDKPNFSVSKDVLTGVGVLDVVRKGTAVGSCTVEYMTTTNGSAVAGTDYYPTNGTITFGAGETRKHIYVQIINSGVFTGDRTVEVSLNNVVGSALAAPTNAVLTIQESVKAPGSFRFSTTGYAANSGDNYAYLTVVRTNGTTGSATVYYKTVAGTAQPGVDYKSADSSVTFNSGDSTAQISIELLNNTIAKPPVSFSVYLFNPPATAGVALVDPTNAVVNIVNTNNGYGFVSATNLVDESKGTVLVYVQRYGSSLATTTVNYGTTNGTALAGINYQGVSGALTFFPGEVQKPITVPIMRDPNANGDVTFNVGLTQPGGAQLVAPAVTTVVLQDADAGFSFTNTTITVTKNAGAAVVTVVCSNPRVEPVITSTNVIPLQVDYTTADGTAVAGVEYQKVTGTLVFTNGIGTNTFVIPIYANGLVTGDRAFTVSLVNPTAPGQLKAPSTQTVVIQDNNTAVSFSKANYTAFKNGVAAVIDVNRIGYTNSVVSVNFMVTNGTAVNGVNFVSTNGTLTFTNGVTKQTFLVPLIAGNTVQPNLTVALRLLEPVDCRIASPGAATLTLLENSGSYVAPAGAQMVTNYTSHLTDGIIYSNDTVQVLFGFRVSAGYEVTNLVAYLLATNGVTLPSPASQGYGSLKTYGHSVSMPFTFTAKGTNGQAISPTFALYDNTKYLGTAVFGFTLGSWTQTFVNTNMIVIKDNAAASPYPSVISVSGVGGALTKATVTLTNMTHGSVRDVSALVVSPANKSTLVMSWAGGVYSVKGITLTFDDAATNGLSEPIVSGTNKPTANLVPISFP